MAFELMRRRSDPFWDQLLDLRRNFDDFFTFVTPQFESFGKRGGMWNPAVESYVKDGKFTLKAQLPGVDIKQVQVSAQGDMLTIRGEKKERSETKDANFFCREFSYGAFERAVPLPEGVKTDALEANYVDGELTVTAPVAAKALPRSVEVKVGLPPEARKTAA